MSFLAALEEHRLVAILRAASADRFVEVAKVLQESGVRVVEAALTTSGAPEAIASMRSALGAGTLVGAGSARTPSDVDTAAAAGVAFLVTPTVVPAVLARASEWGLPVVCGALTPTEIDQAWRLGATAVKVFPAAEAGGPGYLRAVRAPLPDVPLVPTGGVALDDIGPYLAAGATAVGVGSPLLGDALTGGTLADLAGRAAAFAAACRR